MKRHVRNILTLPSVNAKSICVVGEFNFWNQEDLPMERLERGVWEVFTTRGYEGFAAARFTMAWQSGTE